MAGRRAVEASVRESLHESELTEMQGVTYRLVEVRTGRRGKGRVWPHLLPVADGEDSSLDDADLIVAIAKSLGSGRTAAQHAYGDGGARIGTGPMKLNWKALVERVASSSASFSSRSEALWALGALAQVQSHTDAMKDAGAVQAVSELLLSSEQELAVAAAKALGHLACANDEIRSAARDAKAIPRLVAMLDRVAELVSRTAQDAGESKPICLGHDIQEVVEARWTASAAADMVTAVTAALRNLSFNNGPNRQLIRDSNGLLPLLRIVAPVCVAANSSIPRPPPAGDLWRQAAYRAAGALENLAADSEEDAHLIVEARVVPAMKELLLGAQADHISHRSGKKWRESLANLIALDRERVQPPDNLP